MMKVVFVVTAVALVSMSLLWATLAAPAPSEESSAADLKNQLLKLTINRALVQQEDTNSNTDKEMVATFCKLLFQLLKRLGDESLNIGNISERDYCQSSELPPMSAPVYNLDDGYRTMFKILKDSGLDKVYEDYINSMLSRIG